MVSFMPRRTLAKKMAAAALVFVSASRFAPPVSFARVRPSRISSGKTLRRVFGLIGLPLVGLTISRQMSSWGMPIADATSTSFRSRSVGL